MYFLPKPSTCTKCGYKCHANGSDDAGDPQINGLTVCPKCMAAMFEQFCGVMRPDRPLPGAMQGAYEAAGSSAGLVTLNDTVFDEGAPDTAIAVGMS